MILSETLVTDGASIAPQTNKVSLGPCDQVWVEVISIHQLLQHAARTFASIPEDISVVALAVHLSLLQLALHDQVVLEQ